MCFQSMARSEAWRNDKKEMICGFLKALGAYGLSIFSLSLSQKKGDAEQEQGLHSIAKETCIFKKETITVQHQIWEEKTKTKKQRIRTEINATVGSPKQEGE